MFSSWIKEDTICVDRRGNKFYIKDLAKDIQTSDMMVVYTKLPDKCDVFCCPLDAFSVSFFPADTDEADSELTPKTKKPSSPTERMMMFFEAKDFVEKEKILKELNVLGELTNPMIDNLAATMDVVIEDGSLDDRYNQLRICVETRARYESGRLR